MKIINIVNATPALQKLSAAPLTVKTLYRMSKLLSKLDGELAFYNKERRTIIRELGVDQGNGEWHIPAENRAEFSRRMAELESIEVEAFQPVKLPETENVRLSCDDLRALEGFIEIEIDEKGDTAT